MFNWNLYPFTNFNNINMDWVLEKISELLHIQWRATATSLPPGSDATATVTGDPLAPVLELGLPTGSVGPAGVSPEVTVEAITGGTRVTITDADHPTGQTFDVLDGANGETPFTAIAPVFDVSVDYFVNDYVWYNGVLCQFITNHAAGAWDASEVQPTSVTQHMLNAYDTITELSYSSGGVGYVKYFDGTTATSNVNSYTDYINVAGFTHLLYHRQGNYNALPTGGIAFYDSNFGYISGVENVGGQGSNMYMPDPFITAIPDNAMYVRATYYTNAGTYGSFYIYGLVKGAALRETSRLGNYPYVYHGSRILLTPQRFDIFEDYTIPNRNADTKTLQDIAIYDKTLFALYETGMMTSFNLDSKSSIASFNLGSYDPDNHAGTMHFGRQFFSDNLQYPALYCSGNLTNMTCAVESVTTTSATLKQNIVFSLSTHLKASGSMALIDSDGNRIYYIQRTKAGIGNTSNSLYVCVFNLPALTDGTLVNGVLTVTLTDSDVIDSYTIWDYKTFYQTGLVVNDQLLIVHGKSQNIDGSYVGVTAYRASDGATLAHIDLTDLVNYEPEGLEVNNGRLYIAFNKTGINVYYLTL